MASILFPAVTLWASAAAAQGGSREEKVTVPASSRPPAGLCRVWLKEVPAGQQPAPTDCASAIRRAPPSATILFGGIKDENSPPSRPRSGAAVVGGRVIDVPRARSTPSRGALHGPEEGAPSRTMTPAPGAARGVQPTPHPAPPPPVKPPEKPQS